MAHAKGLSNTINQKDITAFRRPHPSAWTLRKVMPAAVHRASSVWRRRDRDAELLQNPLEQNRPPSVDNLTKHQKRRWVKNIASQDWIDVMNYTIPNMTVSAGMRYLTVPIKEKFRFSPLSWQNQHIFKITTLKQTDPQPAFS